VARFPPNEAGNEIAGVPFAVAVGVAVVVALVVVLAAVVPVHAQATYQFEWRAIGSVTHWVGGRDSEATSVDTRSGSATLTLVRDPSPDVRFAFEFSGAEGRGDGFVPRAADAVLDPNITFPSPFTIPLPPANVRTQAGSFRASTPNALPPAFAIVYSEAFVCRSTPEACGNVKRWDVRFIGNARRVSPSAPPTP